MKLSGSNCSPSPGLTASSTLGSASADNASETPCQILSRVRGSASSVASSESAHPVAASDEPVRMATASAAADGSRVHRNNSRSEEHTSELQSLMRISYAVFCLKKKKTI